MIRVAHNSELKASWIIKNQNRCAEPQRHEQSQHGFGDRLDKRRPDLEVKNGLDLVESNWFLDSYNCQFYHISLPACNVNHTIKCSYVNCTLPLGFKIVVDDRWRLFKSWCWYLESRATESQYMIEKEKYRIIPQFHAYNNLIYTVILASNMLFKREFLLLMTQKIH